MSKRKSERAEFTNSAGDTFRLLPLNPLEEQIIQQQIEADWKASGRALPERPYREDETVTGETQRIPLQKREDAATPEQAAQWDAYQAALAEMNAQQGERFLTSCFLSVDADPADYPRWKMRMRGLGVTIPEDEFERMLLFGKTWVIRSKEDIPELIFAVSSTVAAVSAEAREAAEAMFRREVEAAAQRAGAAA